MNETQRKNAESQMQMALGMLLQTASDKNTNVVEAIHTALLKIADNNTNEVLLACCTAADNVTEKNHDHLVIVLGVMAKICEDHIRKIDGTSIVAIIQLTIRVMKQFNELDKIQLPTSNILVALGREHCVLVMEALLKELNNNGTLPHNMIIHTLGTLATSNPFAVVPYIKNILTILIPVLETVKKDAAKQAFSYALGSFAEGILEYVSQTKQPADPTVTVELFHDEFSAIYDVLFSSWLLSKDEAVIESVVNAIGLIFPVLSSEKVTQQTGKVVVALLLLYKKQSSHYAMKCLGSVILVTSRTNGTLLEPLLGGILQSVSDSVCFTPDYAQPNSLGKHSESLRCYECLASHFTDHTIDYLIGQLKNNNEKERIRSLLVISHLANFVDSVIRNRLKDLLKCLNDALHDSSIRVKKVLLKTIVAFAYKGFLDDKNENQAQTAKFIEFILKLCCKQTAIRNTDVSADDLFDLQKTAGTTLHMLTTSLPALHDVLWKVLLKCFISHLYEEAYIVILRCLTNLASKQDFIKDRNEEILTRCLALLSNPLTDFRGTYVMKFLRHIKLNEGALWKTSVLENKLGQLQNYLDQNHENFNQNEWQDLVLDFLAVIVDNSKEVNYCEVIIKMIEEQLDYYGTVKHTLSDANNKSTEKQFLLKCLAVMACHLHDKLMVLQILKIILESVKLSDTTELQTCAKAVGTCARKHVLTVLDQLAIVRKELLSKKSTKFFHFSFVKEHKGEHDLENVRYAVICSYAEVCNEALPELLVPIVEHEILDFVVDQLKNCKSNVVRKACLRAIGCVAEAMQPNKNLQHIRMQNRDEILRIVMGQMQLHSGAEYIELFPSVLTVITSLIRLPLPLESSQKIDLIKLVFDNVYNAAAIYYKINLEDGSLYNGDSNLVPYITGSFSKLNQLSVQLLVQSMCPATLDEVLTLLEPWLGRRRVEQRLPAMETLRVLLQTYLHNLRFAYDAPRSFASGTLLSRVVPRCTDPNKNIRKVAVDCLLLILCIAARYEGHVKDHDKTLTDSLQNITNNITTNEPKLLYNLTTDLAHVISLNIPQSQLSHFVFGLLDALTDCEEASSLGSSVVLNATLKSKGAELHAHVADVFGRLIVQLDNVKCARTRFSALRAMLSLAAHHPKVAVAKLLAQPLPFSQSVCDCWSVLSTNTTLALDILEQLKRTIKQSPVFEEESSSLKYTPLHALQAVSALHELFKTTQLQDTCNQQFSELFSLLFVTLASYIGTTCSLKDQDTSQNRKLYKLNPATVALDTFKLFLLCCGSSRSAASLLLCTHLEEDQQLVHFQQMASSLVESVSLEKNDTMSWLVASLGPYIRSDIESQRIAATCFFANLLKIKAHDQIMLAENLIEMLLDVQSDASCMVRKLAIQGLGNGMDSLSIELIVRHSNSILSALMQGLDYNNISTEMFIILETMLSFSKLLQKMEGYKLSSFQITAAVRIKPLLSQENVDLRRAAFRLFGDLTSSVNVESKSEAFKEQLEGNLITFLLHLSDPDIDVVKACKYTLRKISPFLEAPNSNLMIQEHLVDEGNLICSDFFTDFVKVMADELQDLFPLFVMTSSSYLKSQWPEIRGCAALLMGLLYSHMNASNRSQVSLDTVCDRLLKLLKEDNADIRIRAIQGVSYLFIK